MRNTPHRQITKPRGRDAQAQRLLMLSLGCGLLLAGGFFYAAQRHFSAVRLGYQNEELRRQRAQLLEEQSRLLIAREQAATPARLESSARSLGMQPAAPTQIEPKAADGQPREDGARPRLASVVVAASPPASRLTAAAR